MGRRAPHAPPVVDKTRGWRAKAGFSLGQVVTLTTDPRIPEDRRVLYAIRFLGGPRPGEVANARWRDLDRKKRPLWRLTLETAFNSPTRREKETKTGAELSIPVHPVLQRLLEEWEARGWKEFMGRDFAPDDLIVPRQDGRQRLVSGSYKQFKLDLAAVGFDFQRQYESRATFRNLALSGGADKYRVDLITHPKPTQGPDFYNRLDMLWPGLCEAVTSIDPAAWNRPPSSPEERVTEEVTVRVTVKGTENEKPRRSMEIVGVTDEREKGFESRASPAVTGTYATIEEAPRASTRPPDASVHVSRRPVAGDSASGAGGLPTVTPDIFLAAGLVVAELASHSAVGTGALEEILRRSVAQATALREYRSDPPEEEN